MQRFLIIIEQGSRNYSAYVPDLPGCIATGKTLEEIKANMSAAIEMHLQGMIDDSEPYLCCRGQLQRAPRAR